MKMIVYAVLWSEIEGGGMDSIWSTKEAAEKMMRAMNGPDFDYDSYTYDTSYYVKEVEIDSGIIPSGGMYECVLWRHHGNIMPVSPRWNRDSEKAMVELVSDDIIMVYAPTKKLCISIAEDTIKQYNLEEFER